MSGTVDSSSDADGEWSDETDPEEDIDPDKYSDIEPEMKTHKTTKAGRLRSKSAPPVGETESLAPVPKRQAKTPGQATHVTVGSCTMYTPKGAPPNCKPVDPVDFIMDRIDAEISAMTHKKKTSHLKGRRPGKAERDQLRKQGVEFDTGDETTNEMKKLLEDGLAKLKGGRPAGVLMMDKPDEGDTGLGSGSLVDENSDAQHIIGKADIYSEAALESSEDEAGHKEGYVEVDSDTAKQLDERFKEIMKSKKGGRLRDLKAKSKMSCDNESIRTEDFEDKFREIGQKFPDTPLSTPRDTSGVEKTDQDSVNTEEIVKEYKKSMVKPNGEETKPTRILGTTITKTSHKPRLGTKKPKMARVPGIPAGKRRSATSKACQPSDAESVRTEDFEREFHSAMVKQVASVPIMSFDQLMVESDLDTVKSQEIHDRFQAAIGNSYGDSDDNGNDSDDSVKVSKLLQKKYQEVLGTQDSDMSDASDDERGRSSPHHHRGSVSPSPSPHRHFTQGSRSSTPSKGALPPTGVPRIKVSRTGDRKQDPAAQFRYLGSGGSKNSDGSLELGEEARHMEAVSARMRKEVESNHLLKQSRLSGSTPSLNNVGGSGSASPKPQHVPRIMSPISRPSQSMPMPDSLASSQESIGDLHRLQSSIQKAQKEKQLLKHELTTLQQQVKQNQLEIKSTERQLKENRAKAEDVRTELMLAEFKRDSARKELDATLDDIVARRQDLEMMEAREDEEAETDTAKDFSKEEIVKMVTEREELKAKVKSMDGLSRERSELERQLATAKEELFQEQKRARQKTEAMQEELDLREARQEEISLDKENLQKKLEKLEIKHKQMERDKNELIKEKSDEYEEVKRQMEAQVVKTRDSTQQEVTELRRQLQDITERLANTQSALNRSEELNMQLKEQSLELQHKVAQYNETKSALGEENQRNIQMLIKEKEEAVHKAKVDAEQEKKKALEEQQEELNKHNKKVLSQTEQQLKQQLTELHSQLTAKDIELEVFRDRIRVQEGASKQMGEKLRRDAQDQLRSMVQEERHQWERQKDAEIQHRMEQVRQETAQTVARLHEELGAERAQLEQHVRQTTTLKQELEEARLSCRQSEKEKSEALHKARDAAEMEKESEMDMLREKIEQDTYKSINLLHETIRKQEEEIRRLRTESRDMKTHELEAASSGEKMEKSLVAEINEECRKIGELLGLAPRLSSFSSWNQGRSYPRTNTRTFDSAMTNLRASGEDLRKHVQDLRQELENHKQAISGLEKSKKKKVPTATLR